MIIWILFSSKSTNFKNCGAKLMAGLNFVSVKDTNRHTHQWCSLENSLGQKTNKQTMIKQKNKWIKQSANRLWFVKKNMNQDFLLNEIQKTSSVNEYRQKGAQTKRIRFPFFKCHRLRAPLWSSWQFNCFLMVFI